VFFSLSFPLSHEHFGDLRMSNNVERTYWMVTRTLSIVFAFLFLGVAGVWWYQNRDSLNKPLSAWLPQGKSKPMPAIMNAQDLQKEIDAMSRTPPIQMQDPKQLTTPLKPMGGPSTSQRNRR
jgi:hypothetical protein